MSEVETSKAVRRFRLGGFGWGVITGLLCIATPFALITIRDSGPARFGAQVIVNGADASRHGVMQVAYFDGVTQHCVGTCDDIEFGRNVGGDGVYAVKVLGADPARPLCEGGHYVTSGLTLRITVAGAETLTCAHDIPNGEPSDAFGKGWVSRPHGS